MNGLWIYFLASLVGYLTGSISFARLVSRIASPGRQVGDIKVQVPGTNEYVESDAFSNAPIQAFKAASVFITMLPMVIVYPWIQRYFTKGTLLGGVKE